MEVTTKEPTTENEVLSLTIRDKNELYGSYMPFVKNGGLFIPTNKLYQLGDEVFVLLTLINEPEKFTVMGKVIWVTPRAAQGGRLSGIGVQFISEDAASVRNKIETYLAGFSNSDKRTSTM